MGWHYPYGPWRCSGCGADGVILTTVPVDGIKVPFFYEHCNVCGEDWFRPGQADFINFSRWEQTDSWPERLLARGRREEFLSGQTLALAQE